MLLLVVRPFTFYHYTDEPNERIEVEDNTAVSDTADELNADTTAFEQALDPTVRRYPARTRKQPDWHGTYVARWYKA